ncbi:glycosyltransferase family 61 protein [Pontimonas sp.]|nr:glycosyltransferase family 61 protein [Pontimonas sp.]
MASQVFSLGLFRFLKLGPLLRQLKRLLWDYSRKFPSLLRIFLGVEIYDVCSTPSEVAESVQEVFPSERSSIVSNLSIDDDRLSVPDESEYPALNVMSFKRARVVHNSRFNTVLVGNSLLIPARIEKGPWSLYKGRKPRLMGGVRGQYDNYVALQVQKNPRYIGTALFVGTRAPYNWYHWIANILPALYVANQAAIDESIPLLLPDEIRAIPQMRESLKIFLGNRPIVWLTKDEVVEVGDLLWVDSPVCDSPFSLDSANRLPLILHSTAMLGYREKVLSHYSEEIRAFTKVTRVFLARRPGSSRPYNQDEVFQYLKKKGFEAVFAEDLTFGQQVALFNRADFIVGPTGAAFANIMFSTPETRALRLLDFSMPYENYFSNLALMGGSQIRDCYSPEPAAPTKISRFTLNNRHLEHGTNWLLR